MRYRYQLTVAALAVLAGCVQEPPPPPEISAADLVPPVARHEVGIKEKTVAAEERKALEITDVLPVWILEPSDSFHLNYLTRMAVIGEYDVESARYARYGIESALHAELDDDPDSMFDRNSFDGEITNTALYVEGSGFTVKNLLPEVGRDRVVYLGAEIVLQSEKTEEFNFYFSGNCIAKLYLNGKLILTCDSADMISGGGFHRSAVFAFNPGTNLAVLKIVLPENSPGEGRLLLRHSGEAAGFKLHRK